MYTKTITYTDFLGNQRTEEHHFNFTQAEIVEMENSSDEGLKSILEKIVQEQNKKKLIKHFKKIILGSYGIPVDGGRRFEKSDEIRKEFEQTEAYSVLFMELATDDKAANEFVSGVLPKIKKPAEEVSYNQSPDSYAFATPPNNSQVGPIVNPPASPQMFIMPQGSYQGPVNYAGYPVIGR